MSPISGSVFTAKKDSFAGAILFHFRALSPIIYRNEAAAIFDAVPDLFSIAGRAGKLYAQLQEIVYSGIKSLFSTTIQFISSSHF